MKALTSIKERYRKIKNSLWFKQAYENKSIGETMDIDKAIECDDREVHTIPAKVARKIVEEVHSLRRQDIVRKELNTIYRRIKETMNDGHDFFIHHLDSIEGESKEKEKERLDIVKTELSHQGYSINPKDDGWFQISW